MAHSVVTSKGQTTIPREVRNALQIQPGDTLQYTARGDHATIRVHPGIRPLKSALASKKGRGMTFPQIRQGAAKARRRRTGTG